MSNHSLELLQLLVDGRIHAEVELAKKLSVSQDKIPSLMNSLHAYGLRSSRVADGAWQLTQAIELLQEEVLLSQINANVSGMRFHLELHQEIDSTNERLLNSALPIHGRVVLAEYQTAGRGQLGKQWISPFGAGVNLSVGCCVEHWDNTLSKLSLATGVVVVDVLRKYAITDVKLKWPNDILWHGKKLGGILLETRGIGDGVYDIALGLGLNIAFPNVEYINIDQPWVDLATIQSSLPSRNELVASFASAILLLCKQYLSFGCKDSITSWRQYDYLKGKMVQLFTAGKIFSGQALGIDEQGALLLMSASGDIQKYTTGKVYLQADMSL